MSTIDMQHRPAYLPQVNAPFEIVVDKLNADGVNSRVIDINPAILRVLQGITFSHEVDNADIDDEQKPIWINSELFVLDGHHRIVKALYEGRKTIRAIIVDLDHKNACRALNKVQDIYDYEQQKEAESNTIPNNFLDSIESGVDENENGEESGNAVKLIGYRRDDFKNNSSNGNFFSLQPKEGMKKYEIEFDNIMDTDKMGISYKNSQNPIDVLANIWFPHVNFNAISKENNISEFNLKCKAIAEKAKKYGFDGIKYGESLIQGF